VSRVDVFYTSSRAISTIIRAQIPTALRLRLDKKIETDDNFCLNNEPSIKRGYVLKKMTDVPGLTKRCRHATCSSTAIPVNDREITGPHNAGDFEGKIGQARGTGLPGGEREAQYKES
jgi:hypothetical protein